MRFAGWRMAPTAGGEFHPAPKTMFTSFSCREACHAALMRSTAACLPISADQEDSNTIFQIAIAYAPDR
jgi:hypothetical protein